MLLAGHTGGVIPAVSFAVVWVALYSAHHVADFWGQSAWEAHTKSAPGWQGRLACLVHVLVHTFVALALLGAAAFFLDVPLSGWGIAAGLLVNGATHYFADRRAPLRQLAALLGKEDFYALGTGEGQGPHLGTGAHALDQAWHVSWLFVSALVLVLVG